MHGQRSSIAQKDNALSQIAAAARRAVEAFNGSSSAHDAVVQTAAKYEDAYLEHEKPPNFPDPLTFIDEAIKKLEASWLSTENLDDLLGKVIAAGMQVAHHQTDFIPPGHAESENPADEENGRKTGSGEYEVRTRPRLAMILLALQERRVRADHITLHVGQAGSGWREQPYILVNVKDARDGAEKEFQIAVCDQVGQATFVSDRIYPQEYWAKMNKNILAAIPGVARIEHRSDETWLEKVMAPLSGTLDQLQPAFAWASGKTHKRKIPLSLELIAEIAWQQIRTTGRALNTMDKDLLPDGTNGKDIFAALGRKKVPGAEQYDTLEEALVGLGLSDHTTEGDVIELAREHIQKHKSELSIRHPITLPNGVSKNYLGKPLTGGTIAARFKTKSKGLENSAYKNLKEFLVARGLSDNTDEAEVDRIFRRHVWRYGESSSQISRQKAILSNGIELVFSSLHSRFLFKRSGLENTDYTFATFKKYHGLDKNGSEFKRIMELREERLAELGMSTDAVLDEPPPDAVMTAPPKNAAPAPAHAPPPPGHAEPA